MKNSEFGASLIYFITSFFNWFGSLFNNLTTGIVAVARSLFHRLRDIAASGYHGSIKLWRAVSPLQFVRTFNLSERMSRMTSSLNDFADRLLLPATHMRV